MSRDIRIALPNSLRITNLGNGFAIELIPTADGARYCTAGVADCATGNVLTIAVADGIFDVLGCFRHSFVTGTATNAFRLVIGNSGNAAYIATTAASVITPVQNITPSLFPNTGTATCGNASGTANSYNRHRLTLTANQTFPTASSRQRLFVVQDSEAPVTYICNTTAGTLTRYSGYKNGAAYSTATQPTNPAAAPLSAATNIGQVSSNILACSVTSTEAQVANTSVVTLSLQVSSSGETVSLMSQVQLDNSI
jgi:MSHA biogenesis protein MshO